MKEKVRQMKEGVGQMSDENLLVVWACLRNYDPSEQYYPGVSMDTWAQTVYAEKSFRGL